MSWPTTLMLALRTNREPQQEEAPEVARLCRRLREVAELEFPDLAGDLGWITDVIDPRRNAA